LEVSEFSHLTLIEDIFFVHERGSRMAIWNFALATGSTMGSVIGGYIAQDLGWRYNYGIAAIALGLLWLGFIFFLPETVFVRDIRYNLDEQSHEDLSGGFEKNAEGDAVQTEVVPVTIEPAPKQSFWQQLKPWSGKVYDHTSISISNAN
jgi:MFS family permease